MSRDGYAQQPNAYSRRAQTRTTTTTLASTRAVQPVARESLAYMPAGPAGGDYSRGTFDPYGNGAGGVGGRNDKGHKGAKSRKPLLIGAVVGIALVAAVMLGFTRYQATRPITVNVDGQDAEVACVTTVQGLRDQGLLTAQSGNFLAVDSSVITVGGGEPFTTYIDGTEVSDYTTQLVAGNVVTEKSGADTHEESTSEQTVTARWSTVTVNGDPTFDNFNFYNGVLHLLTNPGTDEVTSTVTGKSSGIVMQGVQVSKLHDRTWESIDSTLPDTDKVIALTFDDGPNPTNGTELVLSALQDNGVKGTFFMLGENVVEYPELAKKVADAGMEIGSHSYSHDSDCYLKKLDAAGVKDQLSRAQQTIKDATGVTTTCVRPPGGNLFGNNVGDCDPTYATSFVGWDIGTGDFDKPGVDAIVNEVISNATPGAIVLMHDGGGDRTQTADALRVMIPQLKQMGYSFVTIDQLIELKLKADGRTDVNWQSSDNPDVSGSVTNASTASTTTTASGAGSTSTTTADAAATTGAGVMAVSAV